jgi:hypothetical protein
MISAVSTSQNDYSLIVTAENSNNATNEEPKRSDEEKFGYKLSLSDENWKTLGKKGKLSEEDQKKVEELKKIDQKVHTHEQAHLSAAGGYARGGAHYDYVTGPDGNRYANSGHVNLDTGKEKTPEATIIKANIIQKAALAPADPSPADNQIAANAAKMAVDAQKELAEQKKGTNEPDSPDAPQVNVSESS